IFFILSGLVWLFMQSAAESRHRNPNIGVVTFASNQSMKPTAPLRNNFSVFATTPCRGLSPSRWMHFPSSARRIVPRRRARTLLQHLLTQHRHFCLRHVLPEYSSPHGVLSPVHPSTRRSE